MYILTIVYYDILVEHRYGVASNPNFYSECPYFKPWILLSWQISQFSWLRPGKCRETTSI